MVMRTLVVVAALWLLGGAAAPQQCQVECPKGYLAVCVLTGSRCACACAKDASEGIDKLKSLMRDSGASENTISEAVRRFTKDLVVPSTANLQPEKSTKPLSFSVKDGEVAYQISAKRRPKPE